MASVWLGPAGVELRISQASIRAKSRSEFMRRFSSGVGVYCANAGLRSKCFPLLPSLLIQWLLQQGRKAVDRNRSLPCRYRSAHTLGLADWAPTCAGRRNRRLGPGRSPESRQETRSIRQALTLEALALLVPALQARTHPHHLSGLGVDLDLDLVLLFGRHRSFD